MDSKFNPGDAVREGHGPVMEVVAASGHLAICRWQQGDVLKEEVFNTVSLEKVQMQFQQQPALASFPPSGPSGNGSRGA